MALPLTPPRWTKDRFPEEFRVRTYIFSTWRNVCQSFGYQEYLWPLVESADLYRAKSGEDVWWTELTLLTDKEGKISDIALRPEMTPTVTRMVASAYATLPKPVKRFSIANFYRNERPQRGRNREFWQLNIDMFGEEGRGADIEILQMAIEIVLAFGASQEMFTVHINHRHLVTVWLEQCLDIPDHLHTELIRVMDKKNKISAEQLHDQLQARWCTSQQADSIVAFLDYTSLDALIAAYPDLQSESAYQELQAILEDMVALGYEDYVAFAPSLMRWFDYYNGMVFEVFDHHPDNNRAMFGGWRYNGLAEIFGVSSFPAVGCAPWDESFRLFLEAHDLLPEVPTANARVYFPLLDEDLLVPTMRIAQQMRLQGWHVTHTISSKKMRKVFELAEKWWYTHVVIAGQQELDAGEVLLKELATRTEQKIRFQ